jgi:hypothetical protein
MVVALTVNRYARKLCDMARYAQPILDFYCRPCGDYHLKTHPHFAEQQARAEERRKKGKIKSQRKSKSSAQ